MTRDIPEAILQAFVDGTLSSQEQARVREAMLLNPTICKKIHELRRIQARTRHTPVVPTPPCRSRQVARLAWTAALCTLLMTVGFITGLSLNPRDFHFSEVATLTGIEPDLNRAILYVDAADPAKFTTLLRRAETLVKRLTEVEIIANDDALDLLRLETSPYPARVKRMLRDHTNLKFIACANAIRQLETHGVQPTLLDGVVRNETAIDHVVRRLQEGWTYVKI